MSARSASNKQSAAAGRIPPYSIEAEQGVIGSILLDAAKAMDLCIEQQIVTESFYAPGLRVIYAALLEMQKSGHAIDLLTLTEQLRATDQLDSAGGVDALERLMDATPTAAHAEFYIDIVRQKHLLRCIIDTAQDTERSCFDQGVSADLVLSQAEQSFLDITERQHGFVAPWNSAVDATLTQIDHIREVGPGAITGLPTGLGNLDGVMQGLRPAEMVVLAARPSMGKTSLAMNLAENIAMGEVQDHQPRPVGIFSCEMSQESLVMRMLCARAGVPAFEVGRGFIGENRYRSLKAAAEQLAGAPIYVDDTGGLDVVELRARARRMYKKHGIQLIVIDYLQLLNCKERAAQGRQLETSAISANLKGMAKELKVPVLVLSQLSRAPEQRDKTGKPKLSDLRDSGAIEQDADVVLMLRRPKKYPDDPECDDETLAIVDVAKHRNGPTGEVRLNFEEKFTRFRDRAEGGAGGYEDIVPTDDMDADPEV